ncbi:MAG: R3H domain-containing nucleic acid-binding protein [bacterium]|nr:R3H domain-containing nucleic acid-binding protein [bacterium]
MEKIAEKIKKFLELIGFNDYTVNCDTENRKITIFINEGDWLKKWLPQLVLDIDHLAKLMAKKEGVDKVFIDVNNYCVEREKLIVELAKAAARKVLINKQEVQLPAMNAYERRLVHVELATRPDVKTESSGDGHERHVVVRPLDI